MKRKSDLLYSKAIQIIKSDRSANGLKKAAKLLERAAVLGHGDAAAQISSWLSSGTHYPKDPLLEYEFALMAAQNDISEAHSVLGLMYEDGIRGVVKRNQKKAFYHYNRSALLGNYNAMLDVARCWEHGIGVKKDQSLARMWKTFGLRYGATFSKD